jgi:hypothetical protein
VIAICVAAGQLLAQVIADGLLQRAARGLRYVRIHRPLDRQSLQDTGGDPD